MNFKIKREILKSVKNETITIANQLCYSRKIINKVNKAESIEEIYRIMHTARKEEL